MQNKVELETFESLSQCTCKSVQRMKKMDSIILVLVNYKFENVIAHK